MLGVREKSRKLLITLTVIAVSVAFPLNAFADSLPATTTSDTTSTADKPAGTTYWFDATTGHWNSDLWVWDAAQSKYVPYVAPTPAVTQPVNGDSTQSTPDSSPNTLDPATPSQPDSTNNSSATIDSASSAAVNNTLNSDASSGDASVVKNTSAGDATTGSADATANFINLLQSTTSLQPANLTTFTKDIYGNVQGDIMIDPAQLSSSASLSSASPPNQTIVSVKDSGQINNNLSLNAASGDATVANNTSAGSATTGDSAAMANIINIINSVIGSGQSFMGTVNIYGNLDGDILMPPSVLDSLLASNNSVSPPSGSTTANLSSDSSINNLVKLTADSGTATVSGNTTAGGASTGNAATNLTLLNLTGRSIIGGDAILVFVNVMGQWVGMIVNAPSGSSSAALGGGITSDSVANNTGLDATQQSSINNNLALNAASGNALVSHNTTAGSAASGNAFAGANLLNISNSDLALTGWLGILFINVFGSWNGSFGIDTAAGNHNNLPASGPNLTDFGSSPVKQIKVFRFVPRYHAGTTSHTQYLIAPYANASNNFSNDQKKHPVVLAGSTSNNTPAKPVAAKKYNTSMLWTAGSFFLLAGILSAENAVNRRQERKLKFRRYLDSLTVQPLKR